MYETENKTFRAWIAAYMAYSRMVTEPWETKYSEISWLGSWTNRSEYRALQYDQAVIKFADLAGISYETADHQVQMWYENFGEQHVR